MLLCVAALSIAEPLTAPASSFLLAVMLTTLFGGSRPGWCAALLSVCLFAFYLLIHFPHSLPSGVGFVRLALFITANVLVVKTIEAKRRSDEARLEAEESLKKTQVKLAQSMRISTATELAASIIHEIIQPLSAMVANAHVCLRCLDASPPLYADCRVAVDRIERDGRDAVAIVNGLRSLFRRTPLDQGELDLRQVIAEVAALLGGEAEREGVEIHLELPEHLPTILGNRNQLQQVISNLITNGMESMQTVVSRPKRLLIRSTVQQHMVVTEIEDTGIGVSDFDQAFHAFFTTKETGMGMGLAICRAIVEVHGGKLWGTASASGGSVFTLTLPQVGTASDTLPQPGEASDER